MPDQGGCSCVQGISATLCEENIMFWEVSGIGTKVNFLGLFLSLTVPSESLLFSTLVICLLLFILLCLLFSVSCFRVWFLTGVSVSNTQDKTPPVPGSTIKAYLIDITRGRACATSSHVFSFFIIILFFKKTFF